LSREVAKHENRYQPARAALNIGVASGLVFTNNWTVISMKNDWKKMVRIVRQTQRYSLANLDQTFRIRRLDGNCYGFLTVFTYADLRVALSKIRVDRPQGRPQ
jgi:hypothetical protein